MTSLRIRRLIGPLALVLLASWPCAAQTLGPVATRWNQPSTLTPEQAARVLSREIAGESVKQADIFEARKHLRTDRSVSLSGIVTRAAIENLLADRFDTDVRVRVLPVVLQWLEATLTIDSAGREVLRVRGEAIGLAALNTDPNLAATLLFHFTIHEDWKWCATSLCLSPVLTPVRSGIGYDLSVPLPSSSPGEAHVSGLLLASGFSGSVFRQSFPELDPSRYLGAACDPMPSATAVSSDTEAWMIYRHFAERTEHSRTNRVLCGFFAIRSGPDSRFAYLDNGALAAPPASAAQSAVVNNPLGFALFE